MYHNRHLYSKVKIEANLRDSKPVLRSSQRITDLKTARRRDFRHGNGMRQNLLAMRRSEDASERTRIEGFRRRMALAGGMMAPLTGFVSSFIAVDAARHFNWYVQNISSQEEASQGLLLRTGLVTTGVLITSFAYGLVKSLPKAAKYTLGGGFLAESGLAFAFAPLNNASSEAHYYASGLFFFGFPVALGLIGSEMYSKYSKALGGVTLAAAVGSAYAVLKGVSQKHPVPALYEIMEGGFVGAWMLGTGSYFYLKDKVSGAVAGIAGKQDNKAIMTGRY